MGVRKSAVIAACCASFVTAAAAQQARQGGAPTPPPESVSAEVNGFYTRIAGFITRSAEMVPEEKYTWAPTPEVRSFARLFGHIVDDNNGACWANAGLTAAPARLDNPANNDSAAQKMSKADLVKALQDSSALCEKAFKAVNNTNMMEIPGGRGRTRIGTLIYNTSHVNEHYGNIVTYMRLQGMVPPSSGGGRGGN